MTLRTDGNTVAWQAWNVAHDLIWQSCRPGPPLVFPGEKELTRAMYAQISEEEQVISPPYTRTPLDASVRGRKKRKQSEDNALAGWTTLCTGYSQASLQAASLAVEEGKEYHYNPGLSRISGALSDVTDMSTGMDGAFTGRNCILMSALIEAVFSMSVPSACAYLYASRDNVRPQGPNGWKYGILQAAEDVMRAGVLSNAPGSESECVSLVSQFIDWSDFVGGLVFGVWLCLGSLCFALLFPCLNWRPICATELSIDD